MKIMFARDKRLSVLQDSICGSFSGVLARTITAPLDVTKILYQVGVPYANERSYTPGGMYQLTKYIKQVEGPRAFFKGNMTSCLKMFPSSIIQYGTYFGMKAYYADEKGNISMGKTAIASALAGYTSTILTYPMDTIKTRLIVQPYDKNKSCYKGIRDCWRKMRLFEGKISVWQGLSASLLATIPSTFSLFFTYEILQRHWMEGNIPGLLNESVVEGKRISHGFTAAVISLLVTHPFDTCRRKMQAHSYNLGKQSGVDIEVTGLRQCWRITCQTQGMFGLYAGLVPAFLRLVPFNTVMLWSYRVCKDTCLDYNGLSAEELARQQAHHEEDMHDLEYMWHEADLLNDDPPAVRLVKLYMMEQKDLRRMKKRRDMENLVDKLFKYKD